MPQIEQLQSLLHADDRLVTNLLHFDLPRLILTRLDYLHAQTQQEVSLKEQKKEGNNTKYGQDVCSSGHLECRRELRPFGMAGISLAAWEVELGIFALGLGRFELDLWGDEKAFGLKLFIQLNWNSHPRQMVSTFERILCRCTT